MIPAYHAEQGIYIFKTAHHPRLLVDCSERMAVVARATGAAPTYLPPLELDAGLRLIDGGMWANNPVQIAVNEALGYLAVPQDRIAALRIGTTSEVSAATDYPRDPGGVGVKQVSLFVNLMMRGQSQLLAAEFVTFWGRSDLSRSTHSSRGRLPAGSSVRRASRSRTRRVSPHGF